MSAAIAESEPDLTLLRRFAATRDESAFAELVRRHGRLVWGVCRRRLARREDAEDAFQATFLILAVKAGSIRTEALPGWLHRTACRAAIRVASTAPGLPAEETPSGAEDAFAELTRYEAAVAVDEELGRLPRRYRDALVLFHLEELDRREVANRLGVSEATVKALLARGRSLLRTRLARRGMALPLVLPFLADPVPVEAATGACRLGVSLTRGGVSALDLVSVPSGVGAMVPWLTSKAAATGVAAAACVTLFFTTQNPMGNGAAKADGGQQLETTLPADADAELGQAPTQSTDVAIAPREVSDEAVEGAMSPDMPRGRRSSGRRGSSGIPGSPSPGMSGMGMPGMGMMRPGMEGMMGMASPPELKPIFAESAEAARVREALDQETQLEFPNTPLREAIRFLADKHQINVIIDEQGLTDAGVNIDDNVDIVLGGITLRSALKIMLDPHDVTYVVEDEVLKITTEEVAAQSVQTAAYDVTAIQGSEAQDFAEKLGRFLVPLPGKTGPEPRIELFGNRLVVSGSLNDQERLYELLQLLRTER